MAMRIFTESQIAQILVHPEGRDWTIQGLGMLRLYLDDEQVYRLHIWDLERAFQEVSTIHDHPWDFRSTIVSGYMANIRYETVLQGDIAVQGSQLVCGAGGHLIGDKIHTMIIAHPDPLYNPGDRYTQQAPELHDSIPTPGTVTVIERKFGANRDIAHVYWPEGKEWGSAEPRAATPEEVIHFCALAVSKWIK